MLHSPPPQYNFQARKKNRTTARAWLSTRESKTDSTPYAHSDPRYPETNTQTHLSPPHLSSEGQRQGPTTTSYH
eukprot:scaffold3760_cov133-Isochrysis_galbana.AAC.2